MVSSLGATGLQIDPLATLISNLTAALQTIYGSDINVASNSPDGQMIKIFCQNAEDLLELAKSIYASFSLAGAVGTQLDQRVAMLGIPRQQGTYSTTPITIVTSQALTLYGLNQTAQPVFTIQDNAGNQWQLLTTQTPGSAGTYVYTLQAATIGANQVTANTITNQVTTVLGVTSVNNPTVTGAVVGTNEENDTQLKVRAQQSFALPSKGPADAVEAQLLNTAGIIDAIVIENATSSPVAYAPYTVPANAIWPIITGGSPATIGAAIYGRKGMGCNQYGANSYVITRPNGTTFTAQWDSSIAMPLYISFGILWKGAVALDNTTIKLNLATALSYKLGQKPNVGDVVTAMLVIVPTAICLFGAGNGVSTNNINFFSVVQPASPINYFTVAVSGITIT